MVLVSYFITFLCKSQSPGQGLEPWTLGLKVPRSTDWATRAYFPSWKELSKCGIQTYESIAKDISPSGNWTRVSRVTGGDTHHYTNEDMFV